MVGLAARGWLRLWIHIWQIYQSFGRPRFVPGLQAKTGSKPGDGNREIQPGIVVPERLSTRTASQYTDSQGQRPIPAPRPVPRRCYLCNSRTHLASDCPQKSSYRGYTPKPVPRPQVNFCKTKQKVDPLKQSKDGSCVSRDRSAGSSAEPTCSNCKPVSGAGVHSVCTLCAECTLCTQLPVQCS